MSEVVSVETEEVSEEEEAAPVWTPPERTCVRCGKQGPGDQFAISDNLCLVCLGGEAKRLAKLRELAAVSYTHLTLPTIYSV